MAKIEFEFAHICEEVIIGANNNLSIINIFDQIIAGKFPALHPKIVIVLGIKGEEGQFPINISIKKMGSGDTITELAKGIEININKDTNRGRFIATFSPVTFKESGIYDVTLFVGNESKIINLEAKKV